jgi:hypothetical protein
VIVQNPGVQLDGDFVERFKLAENAPITAKTIKSILHIDGARWSWYVRSCKLLTEDDYPKGQLRINLLSYKEQKARQKEIAETLATTKFTRRNDV